MTDYTRSFQHVLPEDDRWDGTISPLLEDFLAVDTEPKMTSTAVKLSNSIALVVGPRRHLRRVAWLSRVEADTSPEIDLEEAFIEDQNEFGRPAADAKKRSSASTGSSTHDVVPPTLPSAKLLDDPSRESDLELAPTGDRDRPAKRPRTEVAVGTARSETASGASHSSSFASGGSSLELCGPQVRPITNERGQQVDQVVRVLVCRMADLHGIAGEKPDLVERIRSFPGRWVRQLAAGRPGQNRRMHSLLHDQWPLKPFAG